VFSGVKFTKHVTKPFWAENRKEFWMEFVEKLDLNIKVELQVSGVQEITVPVSIKFPLPNGRV